MELPDTGLLRDIYPQLHREPLFRARENTPTEPTALIGQELANLIMRHSWFFPHRTPDNAGVIASKHTISEENIPEKIVEHTASHYPHMDIESALTRTHRNTSRNQQTSLMNWVGYLRQNDHYPAWFKYTAYRNVLKMGVYDAANAKFNNRSSSTAAPFPVLNREALAMVYSRYRHFIEARSFLRDNLKDLRGDTGLAFVAIHGYDSDLAVAYSDVKRLIKYEKRDFSYLNWVEPNGESSTETKGYYIDRLNFASMYAESLDYVRGQKMQPEYRTNTNGIWRTYKGENQVKELEESLMGWGTDWCLGQGHAPEYLEDNGAVEIFYSEDTSGQEVVPRLAIASRNGHIIEIRGILAHQEVELNIVSKLLDILPNYANAEDYITRVDALVRLGQIEQKNAMGLNLTLSELQILYQTDGLVPGFGYDDDNVFETYCKTDPRLLEIMSNRDIENDLQQLYPGITPAEKLTIVNNISSEIGWLYVHQQNDPDLEKQQWEWTIDNGSASSIMQRLETEEHTKALLDSEYFKKVLRLMIHDSDFDVEYIPSSMLMKLFDLPNVLDKESSLLLTGLIRPQEITVLLPRMEGLDDGVLERLLELHDNNYEFLVKNIRSFRDISQLHANVIIEGLEAKAHNDDMELYEIERFIEKVLKAFDSQARELLVDFVEELYKDTFGESEDDSLLKEYSLLDDDDEDEGDWDDPSDDWTKNYF